jgi:hypothetical protein
MRAVMISLLAFPLLSGCIARVAADVVAAPIKVASKAVDVATTSQSEADEKRGRAMRRHEEAMGKLLRKREKLVKDCQTSQRACDEVEAVDQQIAEQENLAPR